MKIGLFSTAVSGWQGGGSVYFVALAAALAKSHQVELYSTQAVDRVADKYYFPHFDAWPQAHLEPRRSGISLLKEFQRARFDATFDSIVLQSPHLPRITFNKNAYLLCEFPYATLTSWRDRIRLNSFPHIISNSKYTARWIQRLWQRQSTVLYPPVLPILPGPKRPYILAVGRFAGVKRSKQQLEMVSLFRRLCQAGLKGWELHLAGLVQDEDYLKQLKEAAGDLPVKLHLNVGRDELETLYSVSSLFWHAVGAGVDPEKEPGLMEHFGIVTVEAMSAGVVPIVINRGGQPEIVGEDGILWESLDECLEATLQLANDEEKRADLSRRAIARAGQFSFPIFAERVEAVFGPKR